MEKHIEPLVLPRLRDLFLKNDSDPFWQNLTLKIFSDIEQCAALWKKFAFHDSLFDLWSFRWPFYQIYQFKPHFLLLGNREGMMGLLPLWYDQEENFYCWFGSWWQEDNKFFSRHRLAIPVLLALSPQPLRLNAIEPSSAIDAAQSDATIIFHSDESKYVLDLDCFHSVDDYLMSLKKNSRHNIKKDCKRVEFQKPKIIFNRWADIDKMSSISFQRFQQKGDETLWADEQKDLAVFKKMLRNSDVEYQTRLITVQIAEQIAGVDFCCIFNGCYYTLLCGYDVENFPGIGNYFNLLEIEDAKGLGLSMVDFLQNSYGWKQKFFQEKPLLKYEA